MKRYAIFECYNGTRDLAYETNQRAEAIRLSQTWHKAHEMDYEVEQNDKNGFFVQNKIIAINGNLV